MGADKWLCGRAGGKNAARLREMSTVTLPVVVEQIFITLMGLINTAMISTLGTEALSAAGHINNAANLLIALFAALTTGGTIVVAQAVGAKNFDKAAAAGAQAVTLSVLFSLAMTVLLAVLQQPVVNALFGASDARMVEAGHIYYLYVNLSFPLLAVTQTFFGVMRGSGDTASPMKISLFMNVINFLASYLLIVGVRLPIPWTERTLYITSLGMHGAGLALTLARLAGLLAACYVIFFRNNRVRLHTIALFKPAWATQKAILGLGLPTSVESTLFQAGRLITQIYIIGMGTAAMAANTVANNIFGFVNVPGMALSTGVMILVGQRTGRREIDDIYQTTLFAVAVGMGFMGAICLLLLPTGGLLAQVYHLDGPSAVYFKQLLVSCYIATPLLWPLAFVLPSSLRAVGDVTFTMFCAVASMWVFRIAIGYVLGVMLGWGVLGVWCGMYADWMVRAALFFIRLRGARWKKKIMVSDM